MTAITLNDESTWPGEVLQCLDKHKQILYSWEAENSRTDDTVGTAKLYDQAHDDVYDCLSKYSLRGYHCTRLTQHEITVVQNDGLTLQNLQTLTVRIDRLLQDGLLTPKMADDLKNKNEANAPNRLGKLWFCFFPPHKSGEDGIGRFFRFWGGEALYNCHENTPAGAVLRKIGNPCILEAVVPIKFLPKYCYLTNKIARVYLKNRGFSTDECCNLEAYATGSIPSDNIQRIMRYPEPDFLNLTQCKSWDNEILAV